VTFAVAAAGAESAELFRISEIEIRRAALLIHAQLNLGLSFLGETLPVVCTLEKRRLKIA
jgi:hypothetical protein